MKSRTLISRDQFLNSKTDYSPLLVHLIRKKKGCYASQVLDTILSEKTLRAYDHHCAFDKSLRQPKYAKLSEQFKVVCFTETPLDQMDVLLQEIEGRWYQLQPYGLVFKKAFIREMGGNPVFYVTKQVANPLWKLYWKLNTEEFSEVVRKNICHTLALVTLCDETSDWHWEREWRIVGDFRFSLDRVYCGICPESDISYFNNTYFPVKFIDPCWQRNRIFDELVKKN